jgi:hypothetical protein
MSRSECVRVRRATGQCRDNDDDDVCGKLE